MHTWCLLKGNKIPLVFFEYDSRGINKIRERINITIRHMLLWMIFMVNVQITNCRQMINHMIPTAHRSLSIPDGCGTTAALEWRVDVEHFIVTRMYIIASYHFQCLFLMMMMTRVTSALMKYWHSPMLNNQPPHQLHSHSPPLHNSTQTKRSWMVE